MGPAGYGRGLSVCGRSWVLSLFVEIWVVLRTCQAEVARAVSQSEIWKRLPVRVFGCGALGFGSGAGGHRWATGVKHQSDLIERQE